MSTVGDVSAHNVVLGQIRGEAVYIFDLEEVATVIALHRKVGTNVVVDLRLKGLKEPRENDIWLLGAIGPRMVYSTNLDAARRACDRRMVTFAHTAPDCAEIMWNEQNWTLVACRSPAPAPSGTTACAPCASSTTCCGCCRRCRRQPGGRQRRGVAQCGARAVRWPLPAGRVAARPRDCRRVAPTRRPARAGPLAKRRRRPGPPGRRNGQLSSIPALPSMPRPVALSPGRPPGSAGASRGAMPPTATTWCWSRAMPGVSSELAGELHAKHGTECEVLAADLSDAAGRDKVADRLAAGVQVLVNNAGFGTSGEFWTADPALLQSQLDVNVTAVMQFTRAALPAMFDRGAGTVINVSSVAGLLTGRGSTYSASKAWVISFSEGLAGGLRGTGVGVHALCPGFVHTEFHAAPGSRWPRCRRSCGCEVDDVVARMLADVARGQADDHPGHAIQGHRRRGRLVPRGLLRAAVKLVGGVNARS